jgi:hypothetical protein
MSNDPDLARIVEILEEANKSPKAARGDVVDELHRLISDPVKDKLAQLDGPEEIERLVDRTKEQHKQFIAEVSYVVPSEPNDLVPRIRLGLRKPKKEDNGDASNYYKWFLSLDVAHRWPLTEPENPPHIRWGFWTQAAKGKDGKLEPPFRHTRGQCGPVAEKLEVYSEPVTGLRTKSWYLTFLGRRKEIEEISEYGTADALTSEIALDIKLIANAVTK